MIQHSSRDIGDLHPELAKRWLLMQAEFKSLYPTLAQPFLTQTYRSREDQDAEYAKGRTVPGKPVTRAKAGQSLHNYYPALAFDVAFKDSHGEINWSHGLFVKLGAIGQIVGLGWGGAWHGTFHDYPHFEPPHYTWHDALANHQPLFGPIGNLASLKHQQEDDGA